jgi:Flp pilus assembly CpaF family ATPase
MKGLFSIYYNDFKTILEKIVNGTSHIAFKYEDIWKITINSDGYLWVCNWEQVIKKTERRFEESQMLDMIQEIGNIVETTINEENPILEIDTEEWRITCLIPPITPFGPSISIEKVSNQRFGV